MESEYQMTKEASVLWTVKCLEHGVLLPSGTLDEAIDMYESHKAEYHWMDEDTFESNYQMTPL